MFKKFVDNLSLTTYSNIFYKRIPLATKAFWRNNWIPLATRVYGEATKGCHSLHRHIKEEERETTRHTSVSRLWLLSDLSKLSNFLIDTWYLEINLLPQMKVTILFNLKLNDALINNQNKAIRIQVILCFPRNCLSTFHEKEYSFKLLVPW